MAKTKTRRRYFPRRSFRPRSKPKMTLPLAVVAGFMPTGVGLWNRRNSPTEMGNFLQRGWTGIEPGTGKFNFANLRLGAVPAVAGFAAHMVASKIGLNRAIARARIPFIRI